MASAAATRWEITGGAIIMAQAGTAKNVRPSRPARSVRCIVFAPERKTVEPRQAARPNGPALWGAPLILCSDETAPARDCPVQFRRAFATEGPALPGPGSSRYLEGDWRAAFAPPLPNLEWPCMTSPELAVPAALPAVRLKIARRSSHP